ncbi:hypothetical protein WDW37_09125 [Bdellovibrionota bacterium FG-1]
MPSFKDSKTLPFSPNLVWAFCFLVLLFGSWSRLKNPYLWAEDGSAFIPRALEYGFKACFASFEGYFQLVPQGIAFLAAQLPIEILPLAVYLICTAITSYVFSRLASNSFSTLFPDWRIRVLACCALAFAPGLYETLGNACNIHWFLSFFIAIYACRNTDAHLSKSNWLFFTLAAVSGEAVLSAPAYAWRAYESKETRKQDLICVVILLFWALLNVSVRIPGRTVFPKVGVLFATFYTSLLNNLVFQPLLGDHLTHRLGSEGRVIFWTVGTAIFLLILRRIIRGPSLPQRLAYLVSFSAGIVGLLVVAVRPGALWYFYGIERDVLLGLARYGMVFGPIALIFALTWVSWWRGQFSSLRALVLLMVYMGFALDRFPLAPNGEGAVWMDTIHRIKTLDSKQCLALSVLDHEPKFGVMMQKCQPELSECQDFRVIRIPIRPANWELTYPAERLCALEK